MASKCESCGQTIKPKRSTDISNRFNARITALTKGSGYNRAQVYFEVLLMAIDSVADGGDPYPYEIIERPVISPISREQVRIPMAEPLRTSDRTNKEMMTACAATDLWLAEKQQNGYMVDFQFPEKAF